MIRFQADADLDFDIVLAVRRRERAVDFAPAADSGLVGLGDREVLEIAAEQGRILITHDRRSMPGHTEIASRRASQAQAFSSCRSLSLSDRWSRC